MRDLARERAEFSTLETTTAPSDPGHGHQRVDVGDLRKARVHRQGPGNRNEAPTAAASLPGRGERPLDPQEQHGQKGQRIDSRVGKPGELAVEGKRDGTRDGRRVRDAQTPQQPVGADPGHQLEQDVLIQLTVGERRQERGREQRRGLRLTEEWHPGGLVGVPPREMQVQNVQRREVPDRLRGKPITRVDRRPAAEQAVRERTGQPSASVERVGVKEPKQVRQIREHHRDHDGHEGPVVRREPQSHRGHAVPHRPRVVHRLRLKRGLKPCLDRSGPTSSCLGFSASTASNMVVTYNQAAGTATDEAWSASSL